MHTNACMHMKCKGSGGWDGEIGLCPFTPPSTLGHRGLNEVSKSGHWIPVSLRMVLSMRIPRLSLSASSTCSSLAVDSGSHNFMLAKQLTFSCSRCHKTMGHPVPSYRSTGQPSSPSVCFGCDGGNLCQDL